jgi:Zn-dependent protease
VFEAALEALNQPLAAAGGAHFWPLLLGSLAIFVAVGGISTGVTGLSLLSAVLALHEAGHLVAMRAFGYRDTRILFIPFLGAVTTGTQHDVPGEQRAVVLLAGPMPGLLLGVALSLSGVTHDPLFRHAAGLLIGINAFNLLPLSVLDGGKLLEVLLFSRGPWLHAGFSFVTCTLLGLVAYKLHAWTLLAVAGVGLASAQRTLKVAYAARGLRERFVFPASLTGASPELLHALFDAAYVEVIPPVLKRAGSARTLAKACAAAMREIHAQAAQRTASLPASVAILSGYVALFAFFAATWLRRH